MDCIICTSRRLSSYLFYYFSFFLISPNGLFSADVISFLPEVVKLRCQRLGICKIQIREKGRLGCLIEKKCGTETYKYKADTFDMIQNSIEENDIWTRKQSTGVLKQSTGVLKKSTGVLKQSTGVL